VTLLRGQVGLKVEQGVKPVQIPRRFKGKRRLGALNDQDGVQANVGHPSLTSAVQRIPICSFAFPVRRAKSCLQRLAARLLPCKGEI
jgi:hypothetical protein